MPAVLGLLVKLMIHYCFFFLIYGSNFVLCIFKILTKSGSINCSAFFSDLYLPLPFYDFP